LEINFDKLGKKNKFTEPKVSLLYGNNGVGKTTVLEAISLMGHISCMKRLKRDGMGSIAAQNSLLVEEIKDTSATDYRFNHVTFSRSKEFLQNLEEGVFDQLKDHFKTRSYQTLNEWFDDFKCQGAENAVIRYNVDTGLEFGELVFFIYFIQKPHLSITQALSRKTNDDSRMNNLFAILYEDGQNPSRVPEFIQYMHRNSSYIIKKESNDEKCHLIPKANDLSETGLVSFINTDLNDFGRINDIRESVKDIQKSLYEEIKERLALPFDGINELGKSDNSFGNLKELKAIVEDVIREYSNFDASKYYERYPMERSPFKIDVLKLNSTKTDIEFVPKRLGKPLHIDYMSAGENECFFIFLILLGLPKKSIILLDEPDLHLTTFAKSNFFKRLYSVISTREYQIVIATHTLFANPGKMWIKDSNGIKKKLEFNGKVILRRENKLIEKTDELLTYQFLKHYVKTALQSLYVVGSPKMVWKLVGLGLRDLAKWVNEHKLRPGFILGTLSVILTIIGFLIPIINDERMFIEHTSLGWIVPLILIIAGLFFILSIIVHFVTRQPEVINDDD
jgi:predicted ATPase